MINLIRLLLLFLMTTVVHAQDNGHILEIEINNIDNEDGRIMNGLYDSEDSWLKKIYKSGVGKIVDKTCIYILGDVPDGVYAISVYHDEDNDGQLDTNFFRIPSEDTGSSNNAPTRFGPPKWEDAKFEIKGKNSRHIINL